MRWRVKPKPKMGDRRALKSFAWIPTRITLADASLMIAWLEYIWVAQEFVEERGLSPRWVTRGYLGFPDIPPVKVLQTKPVDDERDEMERFLAERIAEADKEEAAKELDRERFWKGA